MHNLLTPLSAIRLNAAHCYSRAMAGTGIINAVTDPRTQRPFDSYACLVMGHVVVAVRWRDSFTFLDPTFGHFFFNAGNSDFATDKELEADHSLILRVDSREHALANYTRRDLHVRLDPGTIIWPANSPPS